MKDKKKKGFTLVEVLGAIAILSILTLSTIFIVSKIVDNSKQKQAQISLTNIKETGRTYIEEFKTNSKYWSGIKEESGEIKVERACTTIGQLIDTGYLKEENIGDLEYKSGQELRKDTIIAITRDINSKTITDVSFNSIDNRNICGSKYATISVSVNGEKGNNNWYISSVNINVIPSDENLIENYKYTLNGEIISTNNKQPSYTLSDNGKNMEVCVTPVGIDGTDGNAVCTEKLNIDTVKPTIPTTIKLSNDYSNLNVNGSTDNITSKENIKYDLIDGNNNSIINNKESITYATNLMGNSFDFKIVVEDEAGNKNTTSSKNITINNAENGSTSSKNFYTCSLYPNNIYNSMDELNNETNNCTKVETGEVGTKTVYTCEYNNKEYSTEYQASNACTDTVDGTTSYSYRCSSGSLSGSTCKTTQSGSGTIKFICSGDPLVWKADSWSYTNNGCPSGFSKDSFKCGSPTKSGSCSSLSATSSQTVSCTNYCSKSATRVCKCSISGKSCNNCYRTVYGDVGTKTKYTCSYDSNQYNNQTDATNACTKTSTDTPKTTTKYFCSLTNDTAYNNKSDADKRCTNYCAVGTYYNNKCYNLT